MKWLAQLLHKIIALIHSVISKICKDVSGADKRNPAPKTNSRGSEITIQMKPQAPTAAGPTQEEIRKQRIKEASNVLGTVEGRTLDDQQMSCVITNADNHLVIAGAGTGKTTTIVAKVLYMLKKQQYTANDIAIFSFTRPSAEEIRERIKSATGSQIYTATFHSYALRIVKEVEGVIPKISELGPKTTIDKKLLPHNLTQAEIRTICRYVLYGGDFIRSEFSFGSVPKYISYLEQHLPRTISGLKVSNYGELVIANFLTSHDVQYIYYPKTNNFLLKDNNLYIEYYSFNRAGAMPSYFVGSIHDEQILSSTYYREDIRRRYRGNAKVIPCWSYQLFDGSFEQYLLEELKRHNVYFAVPDAQSLWQRVFSVDMYALKSISKTFSQIVGLLASKNYSLQALASIVDSKLGKYSINPYFFQILDMLYDDYVKQLSAQNAVTFDTLLLRAINYINSGKYTHRYKYVIVDEYQDVSQPQFDFLYALRNSHHYALLAVGDDWQSIYGFNGSLVSLIMDFEQYWGPSVISKIETTYRFPQELVDICGKYIMTNPRQVRKNIRGKSTIQDPVSILYADDKTTAIDLIAQSLEKFPLGSSVFLLSRNKLDWQNVKGNSMLFEDIDELTIRYTPRPDLSIQHMSVHASKGREADNVIICNVIDGRYGFPNQVANHPVVDFLLDQGETYLYAEERRLFYVALTRTRNRVCIVTERGKESVFVDDLISQNPSILRRSKICPWCGRELITIEKTSLEGYDLCSGYDTDDCSYRQKHAYLAPEDAVRRGHKRNKRGAQQEPTGGFLNRSQSSGG